MTPDTPTADEVSHPLANSSNSSPSYTYNQVLFFNISKLPYNSHHWTLRFHIASDAILHKIQLSILAAIVSYQ